MSKATYWQRGEAIDYKNPSTTEAIEANTIIQLGSIIGVAGGAIGAGEVGAVHVSGIYSIPKTGTAAITVGQKVYYDGNGITDAEDGATAAGFAAEDAAADATSILVKINA